MPILIKKRKYWEILISQIILIFFAAFLDDYLLFYILFGVVLVGIIGSLLKTVWVRPITKYASLAIGSIAIITGLAGAIPYFAGVQFFGVSYYIATLLTSCLAFALYILVGIYVMSRNVFVSDGVTADRIVGSVCIYLLIGLFFTFVYVSIEIIDPMAFNIGRDKLDSIGDFRDFLYFSYITITNTGFGDFLPLKPVPRVLVMLEAMIGTLYMAIMVARLVGIHISSSLKKQLR